MPNNAIMMKDLAHAIWHAMETSQAFDVEGNEFDCWARLHPTKSGVILIETTSASGTVQKYTVNINPVQSWAVDT